MNAASPAASMGAYRAAISSTPRATPASSPRVYAKTHATAAPDGGSFWSAAKAASHAPAEVAVAQRTPAAPLVIHEALGLSPPSQWFDRSMVLISR